MAKLIGRLASEKGSSVSRTAQRIIGATLETWTGQITTDLKADGSFDIYIGPKGSSGIHVATGHLAGNHEPAFITLTQEGRLLTN